MLPFFGRGMEKRSSKNDSKKCRVFVGLVENFFVPGRFFLVRVVG